MNSRFQTRGARRVLPILMLMLLFTILPLSASAAEVGEEAPAPAVTAVTTATEAAGETGGGEAGIPVSSLIAGFFGENAAELLSGATFLLMLVLSLLCRRRLIPPLLESLSSLLGKSRDVADALTAGQAEERAELSRLFGEAEGILTEVKAAAERAEEAADRIRTSEDGRREGALILREQTALLYELLMAADLPQYQKERIGAAHAAATAALAELSHD